jgi:hypothetical protein
VIQFILLWQRLNCENVDHPAVYECDICILALNPLSLECHLDEWSVHQPSTHHGLLFVDLST